MLASLALGQPANWSPDQRTKDLWCLGIWLGEKLATSPDEERRKLVWFFNRKARAAEDLFDLAATALHQHETGVPLFYGGR